MKPLSSPRTLAALTPKEWADFFPDEQMEELRRLLPDFHSVNPVELSAAEWENLLGERQPEVLLSCWKTPSLPPSWPVGRAGGLRYVCHLSGSVRKLVPPGLIEDGLLVTNWGRSISRVVAECGLLLILGALRRCNAWALAMHAEGGWKNEHTVFHSLFERRVGMHGFGAIAQELVRLLQPFQVRLETYSPSVPDSLLREFGVLRSPSLEHLFAQNDVIVELAALTPRNHHLVTESLLRLIPQDGVFVNIGRGAVVDEEALARVAAEGKIQVAADVFETEPLPPGSPLRGLRNVMLLPHLGGPTIDRRRDSGRLALRNLRAYLSGEPLEAVIDAGVYARST